MTWSAVDLPCRKSLVHAGFIDRWVGACRMWTNFITRIWELIRFRVWSPGKQNHVTDMFLAFGDWGLQQASLAWSGQRYYILHTLGPFISRTTPWWRVSWTRGPSSTVPSSWRVVLNWATQNLRLGGPGMGIAGIDSCQHSNNTIILFVTQYYNGNAAFHQSSAVSGVASVFSEEDWT